MGVLSRDGQRIRTVVEGMRSLHAAGSRWRRTSMGLRLMADQKVEIECIHCLTPTPYPRVIRRVPPISKIFERSRMIGDPLGPFRISEILLVFYQFVCIPPHAHVVVL